MCRTCTAPLTTDWYHHTVGTYRNVLDDSVSTLKLTLVYNANEHFSIKLKDKDLNGMEIRLVSPICSRLVDMSVLAWETCKARSSSILPMSTNRRRATKRSYGGTLVNCVCPFTY